MDLNSTNIQSILGNLSCCIGAKGLQAVKDSKLGNSKCYKKNLEDIVLLDNIYKILKKGYYSENKTYISNYVSPDKPTEFALGIAVYINDELITYAETDPYSTDINSGLDTIISYFNINNLGTLSYDVILGEDKIYYLILNYISNSCELQTIRFELYQPICDSPPIGCDYDPTIGTPYGDPINLTVNNKGCCSEEYCYVSEDLETLYNMALNLCQICKNC